MSDIKEKLMELIAKAKRSMWGKSGLSCELARNMYLAEQLIANGVTIQEWISVEERLPKPLEEVLVHYEDGKVSVGVWFELFSHFFGEDDDNRVTHWMPLPEPPKGE